MVAVRTAIGVLPQGGLHSADGVSAIVADVPRQENSAAWQRRVERPAETVGYRAAGAFSVAFTRFVGIPPTQFARQQVIGSLSS